MDYEQNLKKLEEISTKIDNEKTSLNEALNLYEQGVSIAKESLDFVKKQEGKITVIKQDFDNYVEKNFDRK